MDRWVILDANFCYASDDNYINNYRSEFPVKNTSLFTVIKMSHIIDCAPRIYCRFDWGSRIAEVVWSMDITLYVCTYHTLWIFDLEEAFISGAALNEIS